MKKLLLLLSLLLTTSTITWANYTKVDPIQKGKTDPTEIVTLKQCHFPTASSMEAAEGSKKFVAYYDSKNHLIREILIFANDSVYSYGRYLYSTDADGNTVVNLTYRNKRAGGGSYNEWDRYWQKYSTSEAEEWVYSPEDVLLKYTGQTDIISYIYEGNNLVKEEWQYNNAAMKNKRAYEYSDFLAGFDNLPQTTIARTEIKAQIIKSVYDEKGNILERTTTKSATGDKDENGLYTFVEAETPENYETWTYDENGNVTLYENKKWNKSKETYVDDKKSEYTYVGSTVTVVNFSWDTISKTWIKNNTAATENYAEYYGASAVTNFKVEQSKETPSSFILSADVPIIAVDMTKTVTFRVFRNGDVVGNMDVDANGRLIFTDTEVYNGTHDWFVQTVITDSEGNTQELNCSEAVEITALTALNPVTVSNSTATYDKQSTYHVAQITWEAPATEGAVVLGYNVYANVVNIDRSQPMNSQLLTDLSYELSWTAGEIDTPEEKYQGYYIETVYDYGKIKSKEFIVELDTESVPQPAPVTVSTADVVYDLDSDSYVVTINWEEPVHVNMTIQGYNIYFDDSVYEENEDEALKTTTYTKVWYADQINENNNVRTYVIEALYDLGKVRSDVFEVKLEKTEGIESAILDDMSVSISGDILTVNGLCDSIELYNAKGMLLTKSTGNSVVIPADALIAVVKAGANSKVVKTVK